MPKKLLLLTVHGMGETNRDYWVELHKSLKNALKATVWDKIHFQPIYYQDIVQDNQYDVWTRMLSEQKLDWQALRKFMLFGFSDAATLEHHSDRIDSPYVIAQRVIRKTIEDALPQLTNPSVPVAIIAQSLGCQVISNYIWDAQHGGGIWKHEPMAGLPADKEKALRLETLRLLLTTGCNIPFFVSGLKEIEPIGKPSPDFKWSNYFDRDDILGYPLRPLSPGYKKIVNEDVQINSGNILTGWNPVSHTGYWTDKDFIKPAAAKITALLA